MFLYGLGSTQSVIKQQQFLKQESLSHNLLVESAGWNVLLGVVGHISHTKTKTYFTPFSNLHDETYSSCCLIPNKHFCTFAAQMAKESQN